MPQRFVYFLRPIGMEGPVKIGCSFEPVRRLETLAAWAAWPLEVAATLPCSPDGVLERQFHAMFRHLHSHREWFHAAPELTACIESIRADQFDLSVLPSPKGLGSSVKRRPWSALARQSASYGHRLRHLEGRGIQVPDEVTEARRMFAYGKYWGLVSGRPEDAAVVEAFLAQHPPAGGRKAA